jgi:hypothetical protein
MVPEMVEPYVRLGREGIPEDRPDWLEQALERVVQKTSAIVRAARSFRNSAFNLFLIPLFFIDILIQVVGIRCIQLTIIYPVV